MSEFRYHPSMFRNHPLAAVCLGLLVIVGILLFFDHPMAGAICVIASLLILAWWWLACIGTTLIITEDRTTLRKGIVSRHLTEVRHSDIRNIVLSQGILQRLFGVGTIGISSAGQSDIELSVSGLRDPFAIKEVIEKYRD